MDLLHNILKPTSWVWWSVHVFPNRIRWFSKTNKVDFITEKGQFETLIELHQLKVAIVVTHAVFVKTHG